MNPGVCPAPTVIVPRLPGVLLIVVAESTVVAAPGNAGCVAPFASDQVTGAFDGCCEATTGVVPHAGT
jgi:hypothetical protein